jgi:hypothetical protein
MGGGFYPFLFVGANMDGDLDRKEQDARRREFPDCDAVIHKEDLVFCYPSVDFRQDPDEAANRLQDGIDYLKEVTGLDPTYWFSCRVVIGYTDRKTQPRWRSNKKGQHFVFLPWGVGTWANKLMEPPDEPFHACAHELVHPFYRISELHVSNEEWGEIFCEFMRGPVRQVMALDGKGWWRKKIEDNRSNRQNWGNIAGQFLLRAFKLYRSQEESEDVFIDRFIDDRSTMKEFVAFLFDRYSHRPICLGFYTTTKMKLRDS